MFSVAVRPLLHIVTGYCYNSVLHILNDGKGAEYLFGETVERWIILGFLKKLARSILIGKSQQHAALW